MLMTWLRQRLETQRRDRIARQAEIDKSLRQRAGVIVELLDGTRRTIECRGAWLWFWFETRSYWCEPIHVARERAQQVARDGFWIDGRLMPPSQVRSIAIREMPPAEPVEECAYDQ